MATIGLKWKMVTSQSDLRAQWMACGIDGIGVQDSKVHGPTVSFGCVSRKDDVRKGCQRLPYDRCHGRSGRDDHSILPLSPGLRSRFRGAAYVFESQTGVYPSTSCADFGVGVWKVEASHLLLMYVYISRFCINEMNRMRGKRNQGINCSYVVSFSEVG